MFKITTVVMSAMLYVNFVNAQSSSGDSICWNRNYKLKWSDFQGKKPATNLAWHTAGCAASISAEGYIDKGIPNYVITNYFIKKSSWVTDSLSKGGLEHEQLHFDISELHARKIRKGIEDLRKKKLKKFISYETVIIRLLEERTAMNAKYDKESFHSMNLEKQKEWRKMIAKQLDALKKYASDK